MEKQRTHHNQKAILILKTVIHQRSRDRVQLSRTKLKKSICHPIPMEPETEGNWMFFIGVKILFSNPKMGKTQKRLPYLTSMKLIFTLKRFSPVSRGNLSFLILLGSDRECIFEFLHICRFESRTSENRQRAFLGVKVAFLLLYVHQFSYSSK